MSPRGIYVPRWDPCPPVGSILFAILRGEGVEWRSNNAGGRVWVRSAFEAILPAS